MQPSVNLLPAPEQLASALHLPVWPAVPAPAHYPQQRVITPGVLETSLLSNKANQLGHATPQSAQSNMLVLPFGQTTVQFLCQT